MSLKLRKITEENRAEILTLSVFPQQEHCVESVEECLADAQEYPGYRPVGLYQKDTPVGFAMYGDFPQTDGRHEIWLDRLLIDRHWQGQGLGTQALTLLISHLESLYHCQEIYLSVYLENQRAYRLYQSFGFRPNGAHDCNGEDILVLPLPEHRP